MKVLKYIYEELQYSILTMCYIIEGSWQLWDQIRVHPAHKRRHPDPTE